MTFLQMSALCLALGLGASASAANVDGDVERGRRIHSGEETIPGVAACSSCHGADANQTIAPMYPRLAGQYPDYLVHTLQAYKSGARKSAVMQPTATALSERDMADVAAYFGSLNGSIDDLSRVIR